jgi:hypothetical protein
LVKAFVEELHGCRTFHAAGRTPNAGNVRIKI